MAETTKKVQAYKTEAVTRLKEHFSKAPDLIFSDFRGLTFPQMTELRAKLTEKGTAYRVVRNAFARIAMKEAGLPIVASQSGQWEIDLGNRVASAILGEHPAVGSEARALDGEHKTIGYGRRPLAEAFRLLRAVEGRIDLDRRQPARGISELLRLREALGIKHAAPGLVVPATDADADLT